MRLLTTIAVLVAAIPVFAQAPAAKAATDIIPANSFGFVSVRLSDLRTVEALKPIGEALAKLDKTEFNMQALLGVPLDDLERITLFWPTVPADLDSLAPYIVLNTRMPFNEVKVLQAMKAIPLHEAKRRARRFPDGRDGFDRFPGDGRRYFPPQRGTTGMPYGTGTGTYRRATPSGSRTIPPPPPKFSGDDAQAGEPTPKGVVPRGEPAPEESTNDGPDLFFRDQTPYSAVYMLDNQTIMLIPMNYSDLPGLLGFMGQLLRKRNDGPLAEALAEVGKHTIVAAARIQPFTELLEREEDFPREMVPYRAVMKAQSAMLTVDLAAKSTVHAKLIFTDAAQARRAEPVLKTLIQNGIEAIAEFKKNKSHGPEWDAVANPLLDFLVSSLEKADVQIDGRILKAYLDMEIGPGITKAIASIPAAAEAATFRMKTSNNLRLIGIGIHNFDSAFDYLPGNIVGADGKSLMSWRVAILPFIGEDKMYRQLDRTKAWDDPWNAKILEKMPDWFRVYGRDAEKSKTFFQMPSSHKSLAGGSPFLVHGRKTQFDQITDGTSNTIMVVEAAEAIHWAKPDDFEFEHAKAPKLGDPSKRSFFSLMADGSVRIVPRNKATDKDLKAMITIDGGDTWKLKD